MEDQERSKLKKKNLPLHPKERANFLSNLFFCWQLPIFIKGWKTELKEDDLLYAPLKEHSSEVLGDKLERFWSEEEFRKEPSLRRALVRMFGFKFAMYGLVFFPIELCLSLAQPLCLKILLVYFSTTEETPTSPKKAYICAAIVTGSSLIRVILLKWFVMELTVLGMQARIACSALIYRKSLAIRRSVLQKVTVGQIVNLLSNDVTRFDMLFACLHTIWMAPFQLIAGAYFIDRVLGHAALSGIAVLAVCLLFQMFMLTKFAKSRGRVAIKTDYRIRLMDDIVSGIQAIKMYTWEKAFTSLVRAARKAEIKEITLANHLRLLNNCFKIYLTKFSVYLSVTVAVLTSQILTSQYVFTLNCLYDSFKILLTMYLPLAIIFLGESIVSVKRIEKFLCHDGNSPCRSVKQPPLLNNYIIKSKNELQKKIPGITIKNVSVKWDQNAPKCTLIDIDFVANDFELIGVIGPAGGGKSTLLHLILKEIDATQGHVDVRGRVSYASQEPWIFSASIKQNVTFGEIFDLDRYRKVIQVCALEHDLTLLPFGDRTLVGEKGVLLSGGQKARVNLARALYKNADIYLLDNPLSAVDAAVAEHIFQEAILKFLNDKCVILVIHHPHYLEKVDRVYFIETGNISDYTYKKIDFKSLPEENPLEPSVCPSTKVTEIPSEIEEHRTAGANEMTTFKNYCSSTGHSFFTALALFLFILAQIFSSCVDYFSTFWVNLEQHQIDLVEPLGTFFTKENCIYTYTGLTLCMILTSHLASSYFVFYCKRASENLHQTMFAKILQGPMKFFNDHPSGRILNRFSKDTGVIDEILPTVLMNTLTSLLTMVSIACLVIIVNHWLAIPTMVAVVLFLLYGVLFQATNRNMKRTEGIARSSIFAHLSASVQGLSTIRASNVQKILIREFDSHQDGHSSTFYNCTAMFMAFGFWTDVTCVVYVGVVTFSFFLISGETLAGNVGLAITQSLSLLGLTQYGIKTFGELSGFMTSVERVTEYSQLIPEPDEGRLQPPEPWPSQGGLIFQSVSLKYTPTTPPVLKNLSLEIKPGEKIGIVGRTGAGKTSLISILFRLFSFEGKILIDGIDSKYIPLDALRSRISIIPQNPILFLGTVRNNLDPFDRHSDHELWKALDELGLTKMISQLPSGLDGVVSEGGINFSVGERQLLCLVRAMLRKTKIVVLDEATANVDLITDNLIQTMIREKFRDRTVLTIAHRLNTIVDSDKILVVDGGSIAEFGHPYQLLQNTEGIFYGYVKKSGDKVMQELIKLAEVLAREDSKDNTVQVSEL